MGRITRKLDAIEARLQSLIEERLAGLFPATLDQRLFTQQIKTALQEYASEEDVEFPALFHIYLNPKDYRALLSEPTFSDDLATALERIARQESLPVATAPEVRIVPDIAIPVGEMRVVAGDGEQAKGKTQSVAVEFAEHEKVKPPANAFLIVNGSQVFPLQQTVVSIGRRSDNDLVIRDPRVSRYHAQLRVQDGTYYIFDLQSTGGTYVNGEAVQQRALQAGDVISLAGIPLVYAQDESLRQEKIPTSELNAPSPKKENPASGALL